MALAETLAGWAKAQGQDAAALDPDGGVQLLVADEMAVDIGPADTPEAFSMCASVGPLPENGRDAIMEELLIANLEGLGTGGASLSLDIMRDEIVLCRVYHTDDLSPSVFNEEFNAFVNVLKFWRDRHKSGALGSGGGSGPDAADKDSAGTERPGFVRV